MMKELHQQPLKPEQAKDDELRQLRAELDEKTQLIQRMEQTFSWKITKPLRILRNLHPFKGYWSYQDVSWKGKLLRFCAKTLWPQRVIRQSGLFDQEYYLKHNPDVAQAGVNPLRHFLRHGGFEGRKPNPFFHSAYYLQRNDDVKRTGVNPLIHYILYGEHEGRNPCAEFDPTYYLEMNADVCDAGIPPLRHYLAYGQREGRNAVYQYLPTILQRSDLSQAIVFERAEVPLVSIIIPVYNQWHYTYHCLLSIRERAGQHASYEIIVVDDCSHDATQGITTHIRHISVIRNTRNQGFLKNCNLAARSAKGKYLLFLNNDTQVQSDWLRSLVELMEKDDQIGIAGSKLIYPDGRLQEAGGIIWKDGSGWNYGKFDDPAKPEYNYVKEVDYVSGASLMIRKTLWNEIGGFDERYAPAYYEDTDLAFEARKRGYKVMYQPKSVIAHFEGVSCGKDEQQGIKRYQAVNRERFVEKWKTILESSHSMPAQDSFRARDRSQQKTTIMVVDYCVPMYDQNAGCRSTFNYLQLFVEMGMNVKFLADDFYQHEPYTTILEQMGIEVLYGPWYESHWQEWIQEFANNDLDYVYLHRPNVSIKYIDFIRERTHAKILYQGHDLHFLRERRQYEFEKKSEYLKNSEALKKLEFDLFQKADVVLMFNDVEVSLIKQELPNKAVYAIPLFIYDHFIDSIPSFEERQNIMYVGGFNHPPNRDGVLWFTNHVLPRVLQQIPDLKFFIIGSNPPEEILALQSEHILVTGYVSDEALIKYYQQVRVVVIPLRYGAGVKGKLLEAMYHGVPVVATSIALEGISEIEQLITPYDTDTEFAEEILHIYNNCEVLQARSQQYRKYVSTYFSKESARIIMTRIFETLQN